MLDKLLFHLSSKKSIKIFPFEGIGLPGFLFCFVFRFWGGVKGRRVGKVEGFGQGTCLTCCSQLCSVQSQSVNNAGRCCYLLCFMSPNLTEIDVAEGKTSAFLLSFLKFSVPHYCGFIHEIIIAFSFPLIQAQSMISAKVFKEQYQIFL